MLRAKRASYRSVAELLEKHGVHTSLARVAEYGRIVLEGGKKRKRRKQTKSAPPLNIPAASQTVPAVAAKPVTAMTAPTTTPTNNDTASPKENSPYRSRGPHIANVRMMSPEEAKEFNDSLKPKPPAS